jgi:hypothetical protein
MKIKKENKLDGFILDIDVKKKEKHINENTIYNYCS